MSRRTDFVEDDPLFCASLAWQNYFSFKYKLPWHARERNRHYLFHDSYQVGKYTTTISEWISACKKSKNYFNTFLFFCSSNQTWTNARNRCTPVPIRRPVVSTTSEVTSAKSCPASNRQSPRFLRPRGPTTTVTSPPRTASARTARTCARIVVTIPSKRERKRAQ